MILLIPWCTDELQEVAWLKWERNQRYDYQQSITQHRDQLSWHTCILETKGLNKWRSTREPKYSFEEAQTPKCPFIQTENMFKDSKALTTVSRSSHSAVIKQRGFLKKKDEKNNFLT